MYAVVAHGGAGGWEAREEQVAMTGVHRAAQRGVQLLAGGASALDAALAMVVLLEDDPAFNAGTGAVLNAEGECELDAAVMCGDTLQAGAVGCLRRVRNPVLVAQAVMQRTPHVLLVGEGASRFARAQGFTDYDPVTPQRRSAWQKERTSAPAFPGGDTVGAVALDSAGRLAVASSTGGTNNKIAGRIGDSPLLGAGLYATTHGASAATGHGELAMRCLSSHSACEHMARGMSAQQAVESALRQAHDVLRLNEAVPLGLIALDRAGRAGVIHGTSMMPHAIASAAHPEIVVRMRA